MNEFYNFTKKVHLKGSALTLLLILLFPFSIYCQIDVKVPFTPRESPYTGYQSVYNIKGDFVMVGNTNMTWHFRYGRNDDPANNWMQFVNTDPLYRNNLINSSGADVRFNMENNASPTCTKILYAGLYWTGRPYTIVPPTYPSVWGYDPDRYQQELYNNLSDSVPVITWRTDTTYRVANTTHAWYSGCYPNVPMIPTRPPSCFIHICSPQGGPGHSQIYTLSGLARFVWSSEPREVRYLGDRFHPEGVVYYDWVGPGANVFTGTYTDVPGGTWPYKGPLSQPGDLEFTPVTWLGGESGRDSIQFMGIRGTSDCNQDRQQLLVRVKEMVPVYTDYIESITWYPKNQVKLRHNSDTYNLITASEIHFPKGSDNTGVYVAYADITEYVSEKGDGYYWVADMALQTGPSGNPGLYGGWGMIVVYENDGMYQRSIVHYDGYTFVNSPTGTSQSVIIPIEGFNTVSSGAVGAKLGVISGGGNISATTDRFSVERLNTGTYIDDLRNPLIGTNFFASTIAAGLNRNPSLNNNTGMSVIVMDIPNTNNANIGFDQSSTSFRATSGNDTYVINCLAASFRAATPEPEVEAVPVAIMDSAGRPIPYPSDECNVTAGATIEYVFKLRNKGTEPLVNVIAQVHIPYPAMFESAYVVDKGNRIRSRYTYDPLSGVMGILTWVIPNVPVMADADSVVAELRFTLKVIEDCNYLASSGTCNTMVVIDGNVKGTGEYSGITVENLRFVFGYEEEVGVCQRTPMRIPDFLCISKDACPSGVDRKLSFCLEDEVTSIDFDWIAPMFPRATRFYDIIDFETGHPLPTSIEYTPSNPFPKIDGVRYYAVPSAFSFEGAAECYWYFDISVDDFPTLETIAQGAPTCGGDTIYLSRLVEHITPLKAMTFFFSDRELTQLVDSIVAPLESTTYYTVARIPGAVGCWSNVDSIEITVLPTAIPKMIDAPDVTLCVSDEDVILTAKRSEEGNVVPDPAEFFWYASQNATEYLWEGSEFNLGKYQPLTNTIDTFYVSLIGTDYCETPIWHRVPVVLTMYPKPELSVLASRRNLCGPATVFLYPDLNMGTDRSNSTFQWYREMYDGDEPDETYWWPTDHVAPHSSGDVDPDMGEYFLYSPPADALAYDSILLKLEIIPNVCPIVETFVKFNVTLTEPDGTIEIIEQPLDERPPCTESEYIVKIKETGIGGLTNIQVMLDDYTLALISVKEAHYLYPIPDLYPILDDAEWTLMDLNDDHEMHYIASIPPAHDIVLEDGDSLLIRFTTYTECNFYAGNNFRFILSGTDPCEINSMIPVSDYSKEFKLDFEDIYVPEFWITSFFTPDTINNDQTPVNREVTWTVEWGYIHDADESGIIDTSKIALYFNIPTGMNVKHFKSLKNNTHWNDDIDYFYDAEKLKEFESGFSNAYLTEYKIPIPTMPYHEFEITDTMIFEIVFSVDSLMFCEDYDFYIEFIFEDSLYCGKIEEKCLFGFVRTGHYPVLTIDYYKLYPYFEGQFLSPGERSEYYLQMLEGGKFANGDFRILTQSYIQEGHTIEFDLFADTNNDGFLDLEFATLLGQLFFTADKPYEPGMIFEMEFDTPLPLVDGKQILVIPNSPLVCPAPECPLATLFGKPKVCVGETSTIYMPEGTGMHGYMFYIFNEDEDRWEEINAPGGEDVSTREILFADAGKYSFSARYVPTEGHYFAGAYLNYVYMDVQVYEYPELVLTKTDTTICRSEQIELTHFVHDINHAGTVITFYREESDESLVYVGDTESGEPLLVNPWNDTKYIIVAVNEAGCEAEIVEFWVYVNPMLQVWATVSEQITCTDHEGQITVNVHGGSGNYKYNLDGGNDYFPLTGPITVTSPGTYIVYVIDEESPCSFSVTEPVILTPNTGLHVYASATTASNCTAEDGTIKLWIVQGEEPYFYSLNGEDWEAMPEDSIIGTDFTHGFYTIWVKDSSDPEPCVAVTTANIGAEDGGIQVVFTTRDATCKEDGVIFIEVVDNEEQPFEYHLTGSGWVLMRSERDSLPVDAGIHTLTVRDATGCYVTETIPIGIPQSTLEVTLGAVTNVACEGTLLGTITFSVKGNSLPIKYYLNDGYREGQITTSEATITIPVLQMGAYHLEVIDNEGCRYTIDNITIDIEHDLLRIATEDTTICNGQQVDLRDLITYTENVVSIKFFSNPTYLFDIPSIVTEEGWYYVRGYNKHNCEVDDYMFVTVLPVATPSDITANNILMCAGGDTALIAVPNSEIENPVIIWYDSQGEELGTGERLPVDIPIFEVNKDTIFYVAVKGDNYCENLPGNRTAVTVRIFPEPELDISTPTPFLCGEPLFSINLDYNVGNDQTGATYLWERKDLKTGEYVQALTTDLTQPPTGPLYTITAREFVYHTRPEDVDSGYVILKFSINMPVCGIVYDTLKVNLKTGKPDGKIELIAQPEGPQEPCTDVFYIVKVTETGDGWLSNIKVTMRDWFGSVITVTDAHYYHDEAGWGDINEIEWNDTQWVLELLDTNYVFIAPLDDDFRLIEGDSLLLRFTARAECGFFAGNNYLFVLTGRDACDMVSIPNRRTVSEPFNLSFSAELPEFWLNSHLSATHINNAIPVLREVKWTVNWGYKTSVPIDTAHQSIYFNIPTGMSLKSIKSIGHNGALWGMNYDVTVDPSFLELNPVGLETGYVDHETREYQIPLPNLGQSFYDSLWDIELGENGEAIDSLTFEIIFMIDEGVVCSEFNLYVEIIHKDHLDCVGDDGEIENCLFGFVKVGDYKTLEIDLYNFDVAIDVNSKDVFGIMYQEDENTWWWGGTVAVIALTDLYVDTENPHHINITFYADLNDNGRLDAFEITEGNKMGTVVYEITEPYFAGDTIYITIDPDYPIGTVDGKQLLMQLGSEYVCFIGTYPMITYFGPQTVCEGDTMIYYTTEGMAYYIHTVDMITSAVERIPLEGTSASGIYDSKARYVFHTPGTYPISVYYAPFRTGQYLNRTVMEVTVTERPVLAHTAGASTRICRGGDVNLTEYFEAIYQREPDPDTRIKFFVKNSNEVIGMDTGNFYVYPWNTTTYVAVAYNYNNCASLDSLEFTVNVNVMPQVFATISAHPTCEESSAGELRIDITGGTGPYKWNFDGGDERNTLPGDFILRGLEAGNYTVYIYDEGNMICSPAITEPPVILTPPAGITTSATVTNASDCDAPDGSITLTASMGEAPYKYFIHGISEEYELIPTDGILGDDFLPGTYSITVMDNSGCVAATGATVGVVETSGISLTLTEILPAECNTNGILGVKVTGGTPPYLYRLAYEGLISMVSDTIAFPLSAGFHVIHVHDALGCSTVDSITMRNAEGELFVEIDSIITVKCEGRKPGGITFSVTDPVFPLTYILNGGFQSGVITSNVDTTISGLQTGAYNLVIIDANNCRFTIDGIIVDEGRHMPFIVIGDTSICEGNPVNLKDLILPASDYDSLLFAYDRDFTREIYPPIVTDTVVYYVRAFNMYECYVDDSLHVKSWPYGHETAITASAPNVCSESQAIFTAFTTGVNDPIYRWYESNEGGILPLPYADENQFKPYMDEVLANTTRTYYVSVSGSNYCENLPGLRQPVTVNIYPNATLEITALTPNLCDATQTVLEYELFVGDDLTTITGYNWQWRNNITDVWITPNFEFGAGGFVPNNPTGTGNTIPDYFTYNIGTLDLDSIVLRMQVLTNVCPGITDTIVFYKDSKAPNALIELVVEPLGLQEICADTVYVVKVTEIDGGLSNIRVTLDDYLSSGLVVTGAEYLYPIPDDIAPEEWQWENAIFSLGTKKYYADIPNTVKLANQDSMLVRFTVTTECNDGVGSSIGGLNLRFLLDARDACNQYPLATKNDLSDHFHFDWGTDLAADYWVNAYFDPAIIQNGGTRKDTVTLYVEYGWNGVHPEPNDLLEGLHINIPFSMPLDLLSVKSSTHPSTYDGFVPTDNTLPGGTTTEWKFPLPPFGEFLSGETVSLEMKIAIQDTTECGAHEFHAKIIREGDLECVETGEYCTFFEVIEAVYPVLDVNLYRVVPNLAPETNEHYGVMRGNEWSGTFVVMAATEFFPGDSVMCIVYADRNNNNIIDPTDLVMDTIYYPTSHRMPGDPIPIFVGQAIPVAPEMIIPPAHTIDEKQLLFYVAGSTVCASFAGQAVPIFGTHQVCQGEPIRFYTAEGMLVYNWAIEDTIDGTIVDGSVATLFGPDGVTPISTTDSEAKAVFHKPGKYAIYTQYVPGTGEMRNRRLNRTYMEVEVTAKPYLDLTSGSSIDLCFGQRVDLNNYIHDTVVDNHTILHFSRVEPNGTHTPIGSGSPFYVEPWDTTTYIVSGTTANDVCASSNSVQFTINVQKAFRLEGLNVLLQPRCNIPSGSLEVIVVGGSGDYQYSIDYEANYNPLQLAYGTHAPAYFKIENLAVGTYSVFVKDRNSVCPATPSLPVSLHASESGLIAHAQIDSAETCTSNDGKILLAVTGGFYPYQYSLNGAEYEDLPFDGIIGDNLPVGHYDVIAKDASGCTATAGEVVIYAKNGLKLILSPNKDAHCNTLGTINIEVDEGIPSYSYLIDGFGWVEMEGTIDSVYLPPGKRTIMVKDALGCLTSDTITVPNADSDLAIEDIQLNPLSCTNTITSADITWTASNTPIRYSVDNFTFVDELVTGNPFTSLTLREGTYKFSLMDSRGCIYLSEDIRIVSPRSFFQTVNEHASTYINVPVSGEMVLNDYRPDSLITYMRTFEAPSNGNIAFNFIEGSDIVYYTYTPNNGFVGLDTVKYFMTDNCIELEAFIFINVLPRNSLPPRPPIAVLDYYSTWLNTTLITGSVLDNDVDPEGGALSASLINQDVDDSGYTPTVLGGRVKLEPDGSFEYIPRAGFLGVDEFWYEVCSDITSLCDTTVVYIYVIDTTNYDLFIRALNDHYTVRRHQTLTVLAGNAILPNDMYPDDLDGPLTIELITDVNFGALNLDLTDGSFVYTPNHGFIGTDGFTYRICGTRTGITKCSEAYVSIFVYDFCGDMPLIEAHDAIICPGEFVDLRDYVTELNEFVDSVAFYTNPDYTGFMNPPYASVQGYYYVRAFNEYDCYMDTRIWLEVKPVSTPVIRGRR